MKLTNLIWVLALAGSMMACNSGPPITNVKPDPPDGSGGSGGSGGTGGSSGDEGACTTDENAAVYAELDVHQRRRTSNQRVRRRLGDRQRLHLRLAEPRCQPRGVLLARGGRRDSAAFATDVPSRDHRRAGRLCRPVHAGHDREDRSARALRRVHGLHRRHRGLRRSVLHESLRLGYQRAGLHRVPLRQQLHAGVRHLLGASEQRRLQLAIA